MHLRYNYTVLNVGFKEPRFSISSPPYEISSWITCRTDQTTERFAPTCDERGIPELFRAEFCSASVPETSKLCVKLDLLIVY